MKLTLTVNDKNQAMLTHDGAFGFLPSWVEFSRDTRGVRIISDEGRELESGILINLISWQQLDAVQDVLIVYVQDNQPIVGLEVPFISQYYA